MWSENVSSADFGGTNWASETNVEKGMLNYEPLTADASSTINWALFMPKWQKDDIYENNFRLNKGDSVFLYYNDAGTIDDSGKTSGEEVVIIAGAVVLAATSGALGVGMLFL